MEQENGKGERFAYGIGATECNQAIKPLDIRRALAGGVASGRRSWWIVVMATVSTVTRAQESGDLEGDKQFPARVLSGMDMSHDTYKLEVFDCNDPEDMVTRSIP